MTGGGHPALAHGTVDQQEGLDFPSNFTPRFCPLVGQTFTSGQSNMTGFDLKFWAGGNFNYKITNWATGAVLSSGGPVAVAHDEMAHIDLPAKITLTPGTKYAILRDTGSTVEWMRCEEYPASLYGGGALLRTDSGGNAYEDTEYDGVFKTYYDDGTVSTCGTNGDDSVANQCSYTDDASEDTFTVPERVRSLHVVATGGKGGRGSFGSSAGGFGDVVTADVPVTPGQTLHVVVGGNGFDQLQTQVIGPGGFNGGGGVTADGRGAGSGGGASDLRTAARSASGSLATRLVVAGGGGGGGDRDGNGVNGGAGGNARQNGTDGTYAGGGGGSVDDQGIGGRGGTDPETGEVYTFGGPGEDGFEATGGRGGRGSGNGGDGGGGGGGWAGGGGGGGGGLNSGGYGTGAGGGGGSSYPFDATMATDTTGVPKIIITWVEVTDDQAPDVDVSFSPDGSNGWFKTSPATGTVTANDTANGGSNIAAISCSGATVGTITGLGTPSASAPIALTTQGTTSVSCTATDSTDNSGAGPGSTNTASVKLDSLKPVITPTATKEVAGTAYVPDTWTNDVVHVTFACADVGTSPSGLSRGNVGPNVFWGAQTNNTFVTSEGTCDDQAGNVADTVSFGPIKYDSIRPLITATASNANGNYFGGWTNKDVSVAFTCAEQGDIQSAIGTNTVGGDTTQSVETAGTSITNTGTCVDNAGNVAFSRTFGPILLDKTLPVITATATTPSGTYVADTWTNKDVTVTFSCVDVGSVSAGPSSPVEVNPSNGISTLTSSTANGSITSFGCNDFAGNIAPGLTFSPIKIDKHGPGITITQVSTPANGFQPAELFTDDDDNFPVDVGASPASVAGTAADGVGSGLASVSVNGSSAGAASWSKSGVALAANGAQVTVTATDNLGNTTTVVAATLNRDLDGDGIANNIDGNSTVTPSVSQARVASNRFSDKELGGATSGTIAFVADGASVTMTDVAGSQGLRAVVSGTGTARFRLDGKAGTTTIAAGGSGILTDPPATTILEMEIGEGTIEFVVDGEPVIVAVAPGATATVTETYEGGELTKITVTPSPDSPPGSVTVDGEPVAPASNLDATLKLARNRFALRSVLRLPRGASITLPEDLTLSIGDYTVSIPASSLKKMKPGVYNFRQKQNGVEVWGRITKLATLRYRVDVTGSGRHGAGTANPIAVSVTVGNDVGSALVAPQSF